MDWSCTGWPVLCFAWPGGKHWCQAHGRPPTVSAFHWQPGPAVGQCRPAWMGLSLALSMAGDTSGTDRVWNQTSNDIVTLWLVGMAAAVAAGLLAVKPRTTPPQAHWRSRIAAVKPRGVARASVIAARDVLWPQPAFCRPGAVPYTVGRRRRHGLLPGRCCMRAANPACHGLHVHGHFLAYWPDQLVAVAGWDTRSSGCDWPDCLGRRRHGAVL